MIARVIDRKSMVNIFFGAAAVLTVAANSNASNIHLRLPMVVLENEVCKSIPFTFLYTISFIAQNFQ